MCPEAFKLLSIQQRASSPFLNLNFRDYLPSFSCRILSVPSEISSGISRVASHFAIFNACSSLFFLFFLSIKVSPAIFCNPISNVPREPPKSPPITLPPIRPLKPNCILNKLPVQARIEYNQTKPVQFQYSKVLLSHFYFLLILI
uniref:Uncharacterized protein n=1 Tax=Micrurus paraensis TaxID=1970185 RepID=A0A2D4KVL4_9SAUR